MPGASVSPVVTDTAELPSASDCTSAETNPPVKPKLTKQQPDKGKTRTSNSNTGGPDVIYLFDTAEDPNNDTDTETASTLSTGTSLAAPTSAAEKSVDGGSFVSKRTGSERLNSSLILVNVGSPTASPEVEIGQVNTCSPLKSESIPIPSSPKCSSESLRVCKVVLERLDVSKTKRTKPYFCRVCREKFSNSLALLEHKTEFPQNSCA
ncbi:uncharacterized protein LOC113208560 [Frankliniella occidentalis]|uniref:Uncharacterized protein LOC113208560 n=1 Tax=Frankliniella occidentalis TaxID=133901 RepID=A0A9C6UAU9_FRAOC|nr:uncharacterized protein LOC113208560 [Frankliniella occidentalis]